MNYKKSVRDYFDQYKSIYLENFEGCVNVFCDPRRFQGKQTFSKCFILKLKFLKTKVNKKL